MAEVLREGPTCDGYNVTCLFGTQKLTLHFAGTPTDEEKNALILATEQRLLDGQIAQHEITSMMGDTNVVLNW